MSKFRYAYNSIVYMQEPFLKQVKRLVKYGFDAIELIGEPSWYDLKEVKRITSSEGIAVSSICSIFTPTRDLCHPDLKERKAGLEYAKAIAEMAAAVDSPIMIVAPTSRIAPIASKSKEWKLAVDSIQQLGEFAKRLNVQLAIEPWNRYETYFLNRLDQAVKLMEATHLDNCGVHGDMFHMNIEEDDIVEAYRRASKHLIHTHIADSNRAAPGTGHLDFRPIVKVLKEMNYQGYLCFELLPPVKDPFACIRNGEAIDFLDKYTELAIKTMKQAELEFFDE